MTQRGSKKSESLEVRLSHEVKQALMRKAILEGRSASEIVRGSIASYLRGDGDNFGHTKLWKRAAAFAGAGMALIFAYSVSSPATADHRRSFEAARARLASDCSDIAERKGLAKEFEKEFAEQRLLIPMPARPNAKRLAYSDLDFDCDRRMVWNEYRQLMGVPDGDPGRELFRLQDRNRDGWLSENEFSLVERL